MQGKIILNLAISLDGFIADNEGGYGWIEGQGNNLLDTKEKYNFSAFLSTIDIVVMGHNSYKQGFSKDYQNKTVYVATSETLNNKDNIKFIGGDIVSIIKKEQAKGRNIYLFGGGKMVDFFIKEDAIDEYIIGIIPIILGKGRPLFLGNNPTIKLNIDEYTLSDGIMVCKYSKKY